MFKKLNIFQDYVIDKPFQETFSNLQEITSANFYNSHYSTFGNFESANPPQFLFMAKWLLLIRPPWADITSTRIFATLSELDNKSRITITTKTNPAVIVLLVIFFMGLIFQIITFKNLNDLKSVIIFLLLIMGTIIADRFYKKYPNSRF